MILRLIDQAMCEAAAGMPGAWLREVLENGFGGYRRMSDAALVRELELRGLLEFDEPESGDLDFDDDDLADEDEENEDERLVLLSEMIAPGVLAYGD